MCAFTVTKYPYLVDIKLLVEGIQQKDQRQAAILDALVIQRTIKVDRNSRDDIQKWLRVGSACTLVLRGYLAG